MKHARRGVSAATKTAVVVLVVVVVLAGAYFSPSLLGGSKASTSTTPAKGPLTMLSLFGYFPQMEVTLALDTSQQAQGTYQVQTVSYNVLGKEYWNLTQHVKVEFSQPGTGDNVVAWFNPSGKVDRLDVLRENHNYTGPGAATLAQLDTSLYGYLVDTSNNATLLSMLSLSTQNSTTIGQTTLNITTYRLAVPNASYKHVTLQLAAIPGTEQRLAIYLDVKTTDQAEITMAVNSIAR